MIVFFSSVACDSESMEVDAEKEVPSDVATTEKVAEASDHLPPTETEQKSTPGGTSVKFLPPIDL